MEKTILNDIPVSFEIRRSKRKTIGVEITPNGLLVRAPMRASRSEIDAVLRRHSRWILNHLQKQDKELAAARAEGLLLPADIAELTRRARACIPGRVAHFAPLVGVTPGRITIWCQKSRWGSCSSKGNLNFNCLLMLAPPEVLDSVVVHELCHLKELNHSPRFYDEVYRVFPEYDKWHRWLKSHGGAILKRVARD